MSSLEEQEHEYKKIIRKVVKRRVPITSIDVIDLINAIKYASLDLIDNIRDHVGQNLLMRSIIEEKQDVFDALMERKCDLNRQDNDNSSALVHSIRRNTYSFCKKIIDAAIARKNLEIFNLQDNDKLNALHLMCILVKFPELAEQLVDFTDDLENENDSKTILFNACENKKFHEVVKKLIKKGAIINKRIIKKNGLIGFKKDANIYVIPFIQAIGYSNTESAFFLIDAAENNIGQTIMAEMHEMAIKEGLLEDKRGNVHQDTLIMHLIRTFTNNAVIAEIIKKGGNLNITNALDQTAFYVACEDGNSYVTECLLNADCDPSISPKNSTPLIKACKSCEINPHIAVRIIDFYIKKENFSFLDHKEEDDSKLTYLDYAIKNRFRPVIDKTRQIYIQQLLSFFPFDVNVIMLITEYMFAIYFL